MNLTAMNSLPGLQDLCQRVDGIRIYIYRVGSSLFGGLYVVCLKPFLDDDYYLLRGR